MIQNSEAKFSKVYDEVKERAEAKFDQEFKDFKIHPYIEKT